MPHSGTVSVTGGRGAVVSVALLVLGAFSALTLFSFGAQLVVAPVLLPAQWLIARRAHGVASQAFSLLGGLLAAEFVWIALALVFGEDASLMVSGLLLAAGLVAGFLFYKGSRPRRRQ